MCQGALVLLDPSAIANPFFLVVDRPLDEMVELAAAYFAAAVARLPGGGDLAAIRAFEEEVRQTQIRLYHEWLEQALAAGGTSR